LKISGITHTHTQSKRGFPVKTGTGSGDTYGHGFICHLYLSPGLNEEHRPQNFNKFINTSTHGTSKVVGPIKELLSEENPLIYRDTTIREVMAHYFDEKDLDENIPLQPFRL